LAAFQKAVGYVDGKANTYKDIFGSKSTVNFHIGNFGGDGTTYAKDHYGNALLNSGKDGKMSAQTVNINWDPDKALVTSNGSANSPWW
jgi:hypothetical protein